MAKARQSISVGDWAARELAELVGEGEGAPTLVMIWCPARVQAMGRWECCKGCAQGERKDRQWQGGVIVR